MIGDKPARLQYFTPDYHIMEHGDYVICAVTNKRIPLDELRYWDPEVQEAYIDTNAAAEGQKRKLARQQDPS